MADIVIQVEDLTKKYRLGVLGTGTLRHDLNRWWHRIRGKEDPYATVVENSPAEAQKQAATKGGFGASAQGHRKLETGLADDEMWALRGVSFEVRQGEILGIIGRNGAGKSTLLKVLSRVTAPTGGEVRIKGRIASLLEIGTGFHPELTGRQNIFLNGAILGMTKAEIKGKLDEIIAFAEVERYLDTPVKRYSSGMYVRLAFAVAAHLEPEILIVDEVLAVGDAEFQRKCLGKMKDVASHGRTILFVSHNIEAVRRLCTRGIWIQQGAVHMDGDVEQIGDAYSDSLTREVKKKIQNRQMGLTLFDIRLRNRDGHDCSVFCPGDDLIVEISYEAENPIRLPFFAIVIQSFKGACFAANMLLDGHQPEVLLGKGRLSCAFKSVPLLPQNYTVQLAIRSNNGKDLIIGYQDVAYFAVSGSLSDYGYKGKFMSLAAQSTSVVIPYEWRLPDGSINPVALDCSTRKDSAPVI